VGIGRPVRVALRLLRAALLLWVATFAAVCLWTFLWPMDRPPPRADAIVCLGAGVDGAGRIGPGSRARVETCAALARAGAAPVLLFTGGPARPGAPSAAAAMAEAAHIGGIGDAVILLEENAFSTLQNALFSRALLPADARLILVSEAFHLPRSWASFRAMGMADLTTHPALRVRAAPSGRPAWGMLLRESVAIWFNAGRYAAWRVGGALGIADGARVTWLR